LAVAELKEKGVDLQGIRLDELTNKKFCFFYDPNGSRWNYMRFNQAKNGNK
jgi:hypothetical protein